MTWGEVAVLRAGVPFPPPPFIVVVVGVEVAGACVTGVAGVVDTMSVVVDPVIVVVAVVGIGVSEKSAGSTAAYARVTSGGQLHTSLERALLLALS